MRKFGVNTIAYLSEIEKGVSQLDLLFHIHIHGGQIVEIRREFVKEEKELEAIAKKATELGLTLYYSVPEPIFKEQLLNQLMLDTVMKEAKRLNAVCVKFSLGDIRNVSDIEVEKLCIYEKECESQILIENGPHGPEGNVQLLESFFEKQKKYDGKIALTFDSGNFVSAGFEPLECARQLCDKTKWIHLKDVRGRGESSTITMLEEGEIDFKSLLTMFDKETPAAIEYPCKDYVQVEKEMKKAQILLRHI